MAALRIPRILRTNVALQRLFILICIVFVALVVVVPVYVFYQHEGSKGATSYQYGFEKMSNDSIYIGAFAMAVDTTVRKLSMHVDYVPFGALAGTTDSRELRVPVVGYTLFQSTSYPDNRTMQVT